MKHIIFYFDNTVSKILNEITDESGNKSTAISSPHNFVATNEIVAKIVDVETPEDLDKHLDEGYTYHVYMKYIPVKSGEGIFLDPAAGIFRASDFGFVKYDKEKSQITLLPILRIQKDKMKAFYVVHPTKFKKVPSVDEIEKNLSKLKIYTMVDRNSLTEELGKIDVNKQEVHKIKVAQGKEAKDGIKEHYLPLIDFVKKAGKIMEDGSIDFKEVGSIIEIKQRQAILKKIPAETPQDGFNIYGEKVEGVLKENEGYSVGENIIPSIDPNIYASKIDGCLDVMKNTVSVSPISVIKGDVGYESGNIDFHGTVHISGSVLPGFSVKAKGDIVVSKEITDAIIEAGGNLTVNFGIEGKGSSRITTGGSVKAKFILNSKIEAMGIVQVEDSIINSYVFSNDKVLVTDRRGKIIGGETTALYEIRAKISGVPNGNKTVLAVGKNILIEKELMLIKDQITPLKSQVEELTLRLKSGFGEGVFTNPKEFISILPPVRKKACLELLSGITSKNKELKKLIDDYKAKESELKFDREPAIEITGKVYPGTLLKIKKSVRLIEEELQNSRFYEDPEEKSIRFSAVV